MNHFREYRIYLAALLVLCLLFISEEAFIVTPSNTVKICVEDDGAD